MDWGVGQTVWGVPTWPSGRAVIGLGLYTCVGTPPLGWSVDGGETKVASCSLPTLFTLAPWSQREPVRI